MPYSDADERNDFVDLVAQTVIDKIEERSRLHELADLVVARVLALQQEQSDAQAEKAAHDAHALSPVHLNGHDLNGNEDRHAEIIH